MNVGNLLPQETAKITFRYAILYRWAGDRLRFFLPTTIGPRFGESPHLPHQAPEASLTVENQFSLRVEVLGLGALRPSKHFLGRDDPVLCIEEQHHEDFVVALGQHDPQVVAHRGR